jgi:urea carboxylase-associated protein 2
METSRREVVDESGRVAEGTGTLAGAREHARSQAGSAPASPAVAAPPPTAAGGGGQIVWTTTVEPGGYASRRLPRGTVLRLDDVDGDACLQLLVHNAVQPAERLNTADTVKVQWQAYLAKDALLLSDMGRVLMTIVADTSARHDCLCGCSNRRTAARHGDAGASGRHPNARDLLALGLAKSGLSRGDVGPNVNLFKSVRVDGSGALHFDGEPRPGTHIELRAEMDVLVTLANTPHPLDNRPDYTSTPVRCLAWLPRSGESGDRLDPAASTPERLRAYENTADYLLGFSR